MQSSAQSINTGIHVDPYATDYLKEFLIRFNKKLEIFVELLQQEQHTLLKGNVDDISHATQYKLDYIKELSGLITNHFSKASNHPRNNLDQSLKMMNVICVEKQIKQWDKSLELITFCRELSDENSILLANRLKSTNNALDTLYSLTGTPQNKTYDDNGQSKQPHISRQLASV